MSLNVSLPIELENRVRDHVASGLYGSANEVGDAKTYMEVNRSPFICLRKML